MDKLNTTTLLNIQSHLQDLEDFADELKVGRIVLANELLEEIFKQTQIVHALLLDFDEQQR